MSGIISDSALSAIRDKKIFSEHDLQLILEEYHRINKVYEYYYGSPSHKVYCNRFKTILKKIKEVMNLEA